MKIPDPILACAVVDGVHSADAYRYRPFYDAVSSARSGIWVIEAIYDFGGQLMRWAITWRCRRGYELVANAWGPAEFAFGVSGGI
jgi:hypothetical protein